MCDGSTKRAHAMHADLQGWCIAAVGGKLQMLQAHKTRDVNDRGKITGVKLEGLNLDPIVDKRCLIVDDICDGGRTFQELAKVLRRAGASWVGLYVTHGIFSKGFVGLLREADPAMVNTDPVTLLDAIYTTAAYHSQFDFHGETFKRFPLEM